MPKKDFNRRAFLKGAALAGVAPAAQAAPAVRKWDREADVVVVGSGAAGLPASIIAKENGASVILVEANHDIGGHAAVSTGNIPLGGGTAAQKAAGIVDSPDIIFRDLCDWSVVGGNGAAEYRFNDRDLVRAFADNNVFAYDFLVAHGLTWTKPVPDRGGMTQAGKSAPRAMHAAILQYERLQTGVAETLEVGKTTSGGIGFVRPLEAAARKAGVQILLNHKMTSIIRENNNKGRVTGITVEAKGATLNIRARKGVIVCTGGGTGNVEFRRIFDPRLTEEYCSNAGEPYTTQDASGEIAAMDVGASLWGTACQTAEFGSHISKPGYIGCQHGYPAMFPPWQPTSKYFHLARAIGLQVKDFQNVISVNQVGLRFYDETKGAFGNAAAMLEVGNYEQNDWRNAANNKWDPMGYLSAAMGLNGGTGPGGGPIWSIFDAAAAQREKWTVASPWVDKEAGFFFSADTIAGLAAAIKNKYQKNAMPAEALQKTVARYNSFVDAGADKDFDKPRPKYKIETPPFYAAWATPVTHDSRTGLRVNTNFQVQDFRGKVIPGLYCAGESAGGFGEHGIARCVVGGLLAGRHAAAEKVPLPKIS
jgi:succinate dehydrogenase/fumarate reductase flavoprotein subunit